ncbi:LOW QUALITY PROTEIN: uncharacterized protein LOC120267326 [Dioscorea cayenensis subsp. rotundata]|uniref:RNA-directed DNA polymerase n=1 Tax=Dioscorea cayennensis subsp. rotundata TaxID=55577 RepID=A0AB40BTZ5_DIOCR|nr:LOW QUALITY PROTEIN: uncharacterized protein LOC120267326 [Dioscorea cayenensis subsp. rotundata]
MIEEENVLPKKPLKKPDYNILAHLKKVPALLSMNDALMMSTEVRESLIHALQNPEEYQAYFAEINMTEAMYATHTVSISFTDEDLLLGTVEHNRPLYVTGSCDGIKINRILIDPGSSLNLMTLHTLRALALEICHLSPERIIIQGFNQHSQKALGSITLPLKFGKIISDVKFHVIDADASYKALLGRPWIHENRMVPSTLHQCMKYMVDGEEHRIDGEIQPFGVHEIHYEDTKYYLGISKGGKISNLMEKTLAKQSNAMSISKKKESALPHYGSDTESSGDENDTSQTRRSAQESTLHITRVPDGLCKSLDDLKVDTVEQLKTFYVLARNMDGRGILFYRVKNNKISNDDIIHIEQEEDSEIQPINFPSQYPKQLKRIVEEFGCKINWSKKSYQNFHQLWNHSHPDKRGVGYSEPSRYSCYMMESTEEEVVKMKSAPPELEDGGQATIDELIEINLGSDEDRRPTFLSAQLTEEQKESFKALLKEYIDCFAWNYNEMPGLENEVAVHRLAIDPNVTPVKQAPRKMKFVLEEKVIEETKKLIEANFYRGRKKYPDWVCSIVPREEKKNGEIRICVDFRDLNKACPKDDFPLPVMEIMIDNTSGYEMFSFMDGYSGYNQIKMHPDDEKHTAFRTPMGIYCYRVMPFGLKNAGATYQRAMTRIFDDLIHKVIECYVDDLVVKTNSKDKHLDDLRTVFIRLREHKLKMNPMKCAFGVLSVKFLGFIVRHRGIEIDPSKIKAIMEMPPPQTLKQLRSFQGRLAYIRRFISNLSGRCKPFSKLVKKNTPFKWDAECQKAFEDIKQYLLNPPVLAAPISGKPLILYTAALEGSLGAMLAQNNEDGKENALYYLSRMLIGAESKYTPIEKHCLALVFAVKKLRHYLLAHKIILISKIDPLKYLMTRPLLTGRLAKWVLILMEFDITYTPQKAIKGQALADFLAAHPLLDDSPLNYDLPDEETLTVEEAEWQLYFDGASSIKPALRYELPQIKTGIGLVFVTPEGVILRYALSLTESCTNNEAEYEALIAENPPSAVERGFKIGKMEKRFFGKNSEKSLQIRIMMKFKSL